MLFSRRRARATMGPARALFVVRAEGKKAAVGGRKSERKATSPEERSLEGRYLFRGGCERLDGTKGREGKEGAIFGEKEARTKAPWPGWHESQAGQVHARIGHNEANQPTSVHTIDNKPYIFLDAEVGRTVARTIFIASPRSRLFAPIDVCPVKPLGRKRRTATSCLFSANSRERDASNRAALRPDDSTDI